MVYFVSWVVQLGLRSIFWFQFLFNLSLFLSFVYIDFNLNFCFRVCLKLVSKLSCFLSFFVGVREHTLNLHSTTKLQIDWFFKSSILRHKLKRCIKLNEWHLKSQNNQYLKKLNFFHPSSVRTRLFRTQNLCPFAQ